MSRSFWRFISLSLILSRLLKWSSLFVVSDECIERSQSLFLFNLSLSKKSKLLFSSNFLLLRIEIVSSFIRWLSLYKLSLDLLRSFIISGNKSLAISPSSFSFESHFPHGKFVISLLARFLTSILSTNQF